MCKNVRDLLKFAQGLTGYKPHKVRNGAKHPQYQLTRDGLRIPLPHSIKSSRVFNNLKAEIKRNLTHG